MKRKLLAVFLTAIMLVTLFPAASFAAGGQNDVGQLYWFNGDSVELDGNRVVEYFGETNPKNFNTEDTIVLKAPNTYTCGYFALQSNGEYFVMTGLNEIFEKGFEVTESDSQNGAYDITRKEFGTYLIEIEYNGKSYSINLENLLPDTGFYSSPNRSSDTLIEHEFRFADAVEDGSDEAYFYLIYKPENDSGLIPNVSIYTMEDDDKTEITGIKIRIDSKVTSGSDAFYIYKITVNKRFTGDEKIYIGVEDNGVWDYSELISIYGSDEPATANMLYWVHRWDDIEIGDDGKLLVNDVTEEYASNPLHANYLDTLEGYFAVKRNESFYVVDDITLNSEDIEVSMTEGGWYEIRADKVGKYNFSYGNNYTLNLSVELPDVGFYSNETKSEESYLGKEFYCTEAELKNENAVSFYWIAQNIYFTPNNAKFEIGRVPEVEGPFIPENIEGISFGNVTQEIIDGEKYYKCEISVSKDYRNVENPLSILVTYDNDSSWWGEISIYDSTETPTANQLYWFYRDGVELDGNKIVKYYGETDPQNFYANKVIRTDSPDGFSEGYFAVKENEQYLVLSGIKEIYGDGFELKRTGEQDGSCWIEFKDFGTYSIETEYQGKTYSIDLEIVLPDTGFYSSERRNTDTYFDYEFRFADAPKDSNGKAYFYLISRVSDSASQMAKVTTGNWDYEREEWQEKAIDGIEIGAVTKKTIAYEEFYICKITVDKSYTGDGDEENFIRIADDASWCVAPIRIYGAEEPGEENMLYWIDAGKRAGYDVNISDDGMLTVDDWMDIEDLIARSLYVTYLDTREGYFAVKRDGDYYIVDNVPSRSGDLKISKTSTGLYTIKGNRLGKYKAAGGENNELKINIRVELPDVGFYNAKKKSADSYLNGEIDFNKAVNKSADGKYAYFYILADPFDSDINNVKASIGDWDENGEFESKPANGVSIGNFTEEEIDRKTYYVCRIAVSKEYKGKGEEYLICVSRKDSEGFYYAGEIKLYGATEDPPAPVPGGGGGGAAVAPPATDNVTNNPADKNTTADLAPAVKDNKAETTVDAKTADKIVDKAVENNSKEVVIDAAGNNSVASSEVAIPEKTVKELAEKTDANLVIKTDNGKVDLDKTALEAVAAQAGADGTVKLVVETVKTDENICHVDLKLITSNGAVKDFKGGNVKVTINLDKELAAKDVVCVYINGNGIYTLVNGQKNADGTYTFTTGHFSEYAVMAKDEADKVIAEQLNTLIKEVNLKVRTSKTSKKNIKAVVSGDITALTDAGYTVKYKFYRSDSKASKYISKGEKTADTYINTAGKKGTKYYYKAKAMVYSGDTLVGQTVLKQCKYGVRTWSK